MNASAAAAVTAFGELRRGGVENPNPTGIVWRNLVAAIAAITVFGLALGEMFPLLSLIMERDGISPDLIGLNAAMQPLGILFSGFIVPPIVRRFGARAALLCVAVLAAAILLLYPVLPIFWAWFIVRFFHGMVVSTLFSISEAMIVQSSGNRYRGRVVAVYSTVLSLSFGAGPMILVATGIDGMLPFLVGAIVILFASVPIVLVEDDPKEQHEDVGPMSFLGFMPKAPVLLLSVFAFAVFDAAVLAFLAVYGVKKGLDRDTAALLLTVLVWGNLFLQYPIGWLCDHVKKRHVLVGCVAVTAIVTALLPMSFGTIWMWVVLIVIGAGSGGIYSVALAELGERFTGSDLVAGTSSMSTMWGLGALVGALLIGWVFEVYGPDAWPTRWPW